MVTLSPPVSPSVVARILMIQKRSVIAGTLVRTCSSPPLVPAYLAGASVVLTRALEFVLDDLPGHRADADLVDPLALPDVERIAPRAGLFLIFGIGDFAGSAPQRNRPRLGHGDACVRRTRDCRRGDKCDRSSGGRRADNPDIHDGSP